MMVSRDRRERQAVSPLGFTGLLCGAHEAPDDGISDQMNLWHPYVS